MKWFLKAKPIFFGFFILLLLVSMGRAESPLPWKIKAKDGIFLLLSDIHFDPYADTSLVKKLAASPVEQWDSIFQSSSLKKFSSYGKDPNYPLLQSALNEAVQVGANCDYLIVTGDFISHHFKEIFKKHVSGDEKAYQDFVLKTVVFVSRSIQQRFPDKPIYFCLGNNDSDWNDYGGILPNSGFLPGLTKEWDTLAADPKAVSDFLQGGYYEVPHPTLPHHEIVILNDVFWSYKYDPFYAFKEDSHSELAGALERKELGWLQKVLQEARAKGDKVTLETHMPPGMHGRNASQHEDRRNPQKTFYKQDYLWPFLNLLATYRDEIDEEFCGHTHMDDYRVLRDNFGKPVAFTHICPAVSPVHNNNPAFQVMLYDKQNGSLKDMATYYLSNLAAAGDTQDPQWELEYTFDKAYGYKGYNYDSLLKLSNAIEADPAIRQKYVSYCAVESTEDPPINMDNWVFFNCAHLIMDPQSYSDCYH